MSTQQTNTIPHPTSTTAFVSGGFFEGEDALNKYKRKFDMKSRPSFENDFQQTERIKVPANGGGPVVSNVWEFDLKPYQGCARMMSGTLEIEMKILDNAGNPFPDDVEDFGTKMAFLRPGVGPNLVSQVDVLVNGQSVYVQEYHELVNYIYDMLTMKKKDVVNAEREYGAGFYTREKLDLEGGREAAYTGDKNMGPSTMPATKKTDANNAEVTVKEQSPYTSIYCHRLPGSKTFVLKFNLEHPMFHTVKMYPSEFSCKVRVKTNKAASLFQCASTHVPSIQFQKVSYVDEVIRLSDSAANFWASEIIRGGGSIRMPIVRNVIFQHSVPTGVSQFNIRAIQGRMPSRMAVTFVNNNAWRSGSSVRNPSDFPFLGVTRMHAKYGRKVWPSEGENILYEVDSAQPQKFTDAEVENLVRRNYYVYKQNMSVFNKDSEVHELAIQPEDWFTHCNVWCFDFTPTGRHAQFPFVTYPMLEGFVELDIEFKKSLPIDTAFTMVVMAEYSNEMHMSLPTFEITKDW